MSDADERIAEAVARIQARVDERAKVTKASRDDVREAIRRSAPGLLEFMDAAKDRLGARLKYLDTDTVKAGRKPHGWEEP